MIATARASQPPVSDPVRVMVVDDSVVVRGLVGRWIDENPALAVVATHRNGRLAVDDMERSDPDVVVLDVEMPDMDGLTALPLLLAKKRGLVVIIASTLSRRNAETSLHALQLGAADYVPKPESGGGFMSSADFRRELLEKVTTLGQRAKARLRALPADTHSEAPRAAEASAGAMSFAAYSRAQPRVVAIGSSTGGPQALNTLFRHLGPAMAHVPVLVTQHMPPTFTAILAEHLGKAAGRTSAEAVDGEAVEPGRIYIAPGGRHMLVVRQGSGAAIQLTDDPPVNFCRPAVDPLFRTVAEVYGRSALAVVLTGMGSDGAEGARAIGTAGGSVIAQDEATSVVWGMPKAALATGQCAEMLSVHEIGHKVAHMLGDGS
jgi:two-component system chemotaxis response regulator CheB